MKLFTKKVEVLIQKYVKFQRLNISRSELKSIAIKFGALVNVLLRSYHANLVAWLLPEQHDSFRLTVADPTLLSDLSYRARKYHVISNELYLIFSFRVNDLLFRVAAVTLVSIGQETAVKENAARIKSSWNATRSYLSTQFSDNCRYCFHYLVSWKRRSS